MINKFKIKAGINPMQSSVELNGVELQGVTRVELVIDANKSQRSFVTLRVWGEVEVEGVFEPRLIATT